MLVSLTLALGLTTGVVFGALDREFDKPISATVTLKVASSEEAADVNDDGQVDDLDLRIVAGNINTSPPRDPRADVDGDGSVNVFDLAFVGFHYAPVQPPPEPVVVTLGASKDNTLYQSATGALSNGAGQHFFAGKNNSSQIRRGVSAFDIAGGVPTGSTINSVTLTLNMSRTRLGVGAQTVNLHLLVADWGEGTSDALGQEGAVGRVPPETRLGCTDSSILKIGHLLVAISLARPAPPYRLPGLELTLGARHLRW